MPILKIIDIADVECDFELYNLIPGPLSNNGSIKKYVLKW